MISVRDLLKRDISVTTRVSPAFNFLKTLPSFRFRYLVFPLTVSVIQSSISKDFYSANRRISSR